MKYLFTSERLGFRNWEQKDHDKMISISADPDVMEFFPYVATEDQTIMFIQRMRQMYLEKGYCYFAVDRLSDGEFIGFIGLSDQDFDAEFTPCVDVGWRLSKEFWGNGYATEGAKACLNYGFNHLNLVEIVATAPLLNERSISVMKKIGMTKKIEFHHPRIDHLNVLSRCACYAAQRN